MKERTKYFLDIDNGSTIVRKRPEKFGIEMISEHHLQWRDGLPGNSYEREYYLGQGNNCLMEISFENARGRLSMWGVELIEDER